MLNLLFLPAAHSMLFIALGTQLTICHLDTHWLLGLRQYCTFQNLARALTIYIFLTAYWVRSDGEKGARLSSCRTPLPPGLSHYVSVRTPIIVSALALPLTDLRRRKNSQHGSFHHDS